MTPDYRAAATVVLVTDTPTDPLLVLLIQRPRHFRAFAGQWVFPGGAVDSTDTDPRWIEGQTPAVAGWEKRARKAATRSRALDARDYFHRMGVPYPEPWEAWRPPDRGPLWPYAVAAGRETHEEVGLTILPTSPPLTDKHLDSLAYLGRLFPPPTAPQRFDTRFFLVRVPTAHTPHKSSETADFRWISPSQALAGDMALSQPTQYVLIRLNWYETADAVWQAFAP